ncbi:MAG: cytochrome c [Bacteroidetes bacterium]|nr:cytochrome c [Bacteroidota bacterium]
MKNTNKQKLRIVTILSFIGLIIYSCNSSKKATSSVVLTPGETELKAIQVRYPATTSETLKEGYAVYIGPCTTCHGKKDIFSRSEKEWQEDIDRMAPKAEITDKEKDALRKYILAMKAGKSTTK